MGPRAMTLKVEVLSRVWTSDSGVKCILMKYASMSNFHDNQSSDERSTLVSDSSPISYARAPKRILLIMYYRGRHDVSSPPPPGPVT